jgi:hypothetical protein
MATASHDYGLLAALPFPRSRHQSAQAMKPRIVIQFAVTAKEKRAIQRSAKRYTCTLSHWLRWVAANQVYRDDEDTKMSWTGIR